MDVSQAIIYFLRFPEYGNGKTRLRNFLSLEEIHRLTLYLAKKNNAVLSSYSPADLYYCMPADQDKADLAALFQVAESSIFYQVEADLGRQMLTAFEDVLSRSYDRVILVGSDLYDLTTEIIDQAFQALDQADLVLTPALDGGYGLIGMKEPIPQAFALESYSHDQVCQQTLTLTQQAGYQTAEVGRVLDIDDRDDIAKALTGDMSACFHSQGEYNANFLIEKGNKLLRIALGSQMDLDNQIAYEYHALEGLYESGVVPKVYDLVEETELLGKGYLIEEFLPGRPLRYETDLDIAAELLAAIHGVDESQIPHLIRADQPFQVMMDEFLSMFSHYQAWNQKDPAVEATIQAMLDDLQVFDLAAPIVNPCVINTELNAGNFLINLGQQSYIIDWEKPLVGEREQDLGHFLAPTTTLWKTDVLLDFNEVEAFVDRYNHYSTIPVHYPKLIQYLLFTCLRGITWCAMAHVQNHQSTKIQSDDQTAQVIDRFISPAFLSQIKKYIKEGKTLL